MKKANPLFTEVLMGSLPVLLLYLMIEQMLDPYFTVLCLLLSLSIWPLFKLMSSRGVLGVQFRHEAPDLLSFDDIGGQEGAKKELRESLDFLIHREETEHLGIRPIKGILLEGPPGNGKTLLAKAAAHYSDSIFLATSGSEFVEMFAGVGAKRVRGLFQEARMKGRRSKKSSAIIFIDEFDVIGGKRGVDLHREGDQTLNQLLVEMDGIFSDDDPQILIIAATNRREMLDEALLRPGRFDRHIHVDLPNKLGRQHILQIHAENKPLDNDVQLEIVASQTYGFSGAQLENVMNEAAVYAFREELRSIKQRHLLMAIEKVLLGEKVERLFSEEERRRVATHELGHAIIAEIQKPGSVSQITLTNRAQALGFVRQTPDQDTYLFSAKQLNEQIMVYLGGAAAEELYFGDRSTGSRSDFDHALRIVQTMIHSGLTELGIVNIHHIPDEMMMKESNRILSQLMQETISLLSKQGRCFELLTPILLENEILDAPALRDILDTRELQLQGG